MECEENCRSDDSTSQSSDNRIRINSQKGLLYSQQSLPTVPSLTSRTQEIYLDALNIRYRCLATLKGHTSYISSLTVSGKHLYSGSSDKEIRSWKCSDLDSNPDEQQDISNNLVAVGKGTVKSLVVLSDKLFTAHQDHKIRVWKIGNYDDNNHQKYSRLATLPTLSDRATKLLLPKNHVKIRRHKKSTWVHHVDTVSALALSYDGSFLYSVSWDRTLKIWRTSDFRCLESISNAHDDAINAVTSSIDGHIYTGSTDRKIKVWKKPPGEKKHILMATLEKHNSGINALALSSDGSLLYSGACDRSVLVWRKAEAEEDVSRMVVVGALRGHTKSILCLAVVSDIVCSGSEDKTVRIWRGVDRRYSCLAVLEGHQGPVKSLTATIDHHKQTCEASSFTYLIYSGGLDCDIKVWQVSIPFS